MANQILAGAVFQAGQVIAGVDANNPPYVGPQIPYILFGGNWTDDPQIMNALTGETTAVPIPTSGTGIDGTDGIGRNQIHVADGMVIMVGYTAVTVYTDLSVAGTTLPHPPGGLENIYGFGMDVHVAGDYIYVGTAYEDGHLGTIQIYNKNTLQWHSELKPTDSWYNTSGGSHLFGKHFAVTEATDLHPRTLWVGVPWDDQGYYPNSGKVYSFPLDADGLPTGGQGKEIGDGFRNAEYGAFVSQDGEYVAFGYGPAGPDHVNSSPHAPYNGKIYLTNTEYGPQGLALTSGMTDYWTDSSLFDGHPYPPNNAFGAENNRLIVTDDYIVVGNADHQSSSHNNNNTNGAAYGALYFYERWGVEDNWTTTTPVYTFIAENDSPTIDGVGCWLVECDGKLYVGTRTDIALVFDLSNIQATPAQISRPDVIADSVWRGNSSNMSPQLLPASMVPPPPPPPASVADMTADDWTVIGSNELIANPGGSLNTEFWWRRNEIVNYGHDSVAYYEISNMIPGESYELTFEVKRASGSGATGVEVHRTPDASFLMASTYTNGGYQSQTLSWTQPADLTVAYMHLISQNSGGIGEMRDAVLTKVS